MNSPQQVALVTGATDGVGRVVARRLAAKGWKVLVHGRDATRGREVLAELRRVGSTPGELYLADFSSLAEVRQLTAEVVQRHTHLDLLINNAAIGFGASGAGRELSRDGFELRLAVNYLAPFLLTQLLAPLLRRSAAARVVNVASVGQQRIAFDDVMLESGYDGARAYRQSKLALIMATFDLAEQLAPDLIAVHALHPATLMPTTMVQQAGLAPASTIKEGADAIMYVATSPEIAGETGRYFNQQRPARADAQAYDAEARAKLAEIANLLTGLPATPAR